MEKTNEATVWKVREERLPDSTINYFISVDGYSIKDALTGNTINYFKEHAELIVKAVNAYDSLVEENQKLREALETLHGWIKSDSVYTLLRYGTKSPSSSGVDDCEDDFYSDLYNLSVELRTKAKNV